MEIKYINILACLRMPPKSTDIFLLAGDRDTDVRVGLDRMWLLAQRRMLDPDSVTENFNVFLNTKKFPKQPNVEPYLT
jgi:hypothetical protein